MEQEQTNKFLVPAAIVIAGALIAGAIYGGGAPTVSKTSLTNKTIQIPPISEQDHYFGSRGAELVIVEYSDTECPWCKVFHNTMHQIVGSYDGKVAWVYRHMPFHNQSLTEASATECANKLGGNVAFWSFIDKIFEITPSNDELNLETLPQIAEGIGINRSEFSDCLAQNTFVEAINANLKLAKSDGSGISGTPYSVIFTKDGKNVGTINGAESPDMVKAKIDALLK